LSHLILRKRRRSFWVSVFVRFIYTAHTRLAKGSEPGGENMDRRDKIAAERFRGKKEKNEMASGV
jgi:hypothetical protein